MSDVVISVEGLGKKYRIRHQQERRRYVALRDVLADKTRSVFGRLWSAAQSSNCHLPSSTNSPVEEFWALRDVSFEVGRGEVIGIIGRNGAGKSTLLKILSQVTEPTTGCVRIKGRAASLLEVGTGFHSELTGRENIYLNGAILGMSRAEIQHKFDEIVAFAEVEKFMDTPVKRYSSGMYMRLAFAVAAHLEPDILIVDEVLAVGDAEFQKKCLGKMGEVAKGGRTVLFVSHNMGAINALTKRCIYLQDGQIAASGNTCDIVEMYLVKSIDVQTEQRNTMDYYRRSRNNDSPVKITGIGVNGSLRDATDLPTIELGSQLTIDIQLSVSKTFDGANVTMILKTSQGERVAVLASWDNNYILSLQPGLHTMSVKVDDLPLSPGRYSIDVGVDPSMQSMAYDAIFDFPLVCVVNNGRITQWLERPWGVLHCNLVKWETN